MQQLTRLLTQGLVESRTYRSPFVIVSQTSEQVIRAAVDVLSQDPRDVTFVVTSFVESWTRHTPALVLRTFDDVERIRKRPRVEFDAPFVLVDSSLLSQLDNIRTHLAPPGAATHSVLLDSLAPTSRAQDVRAVTGSFRGIVYLFASLLAASEHFDVADLQIMDRIGRLIEVKA
jgi:hypothetical protein